MKGKYIKIEIIDPNFDERIDPFSFGYEAKIRPRLSEFDCPNIIKKFEGRTITNDEMSDVLDTIVAFMVRQRSNKIVIDISERDEDLAPAKEMTLEEIEKKLGYKVKIVSKEDK